MNEHKVDSICPFLSVSHMRLTRYQIWYLFNKLPIKFAICSKCEMDSSIGIMEPPL